MHIRFVGDADVMSHVLHGLHELYESELAIVMSHRTCVGAGAQRVCCNHKFEEA